VRTLLIVNPFATGVDVALVASVRAALPPGTELALTERRGHATELARERGGHLDALYVLSGDGTYNEVVNGLVDDVPVGFLPGGGTSVFSRALGLPRDPVAAALRMRDPARRRISLGRVAGRRFCFSAGIGFDAELVRAIDARGRRPDGRRPGDLAFLVEGLRIFARHGWVLGPALEIEGVGRRALILVGNGDPYTYLGSAPMRFAPATTFEGGLDAAAPAILRRLSTLRFLGLAPIARSGPHVVAHDADRIAVRCDAPMPMQVDGEDVGEVTDVVFEAERDALTVLV
jgi:diacylglycerol kinase family enzyme